MKLHKILNIHYLSISYVNIDIFRDVENFLGGLSRFIELIQ